MQFDPDEPIMPDFDYYVSYSIKGHCLVWNDEDLNFFNSFKVGDFITFKQRDEPRLLINDLPEKLKVIGIRWDEHRKTYSIYLEHTIEGPAYLMDQDKRRPLMIPVTWEIEPWVVELHRKWMEFVQSEIMVPLPPPYIYPISVEPQLISADRMTITFKYDF